MERPPRKAPYVEKVYTEIAPEHLDIHHPKERLVVPKEETIPPPEAAPVEKTAEEPAHASEPVHHEIPHMHAEKSHHAEKHATPGVHVPVHYTLKTEAAVAHNIRHAYRGGADRGTRFARGLGLGTGILILSPFALLFGTVAGMWWLTGQIPAFKKKGGHEKKEKKHEKKDDHGHGGGGGHGHH